MATNDEDQFTSSPHLTIHAHIAALGDWRGVAFARVRALIQQSDLDVVETSPARSQ